MLLTKPRGVPHVEDRRPRSTRWRWRRRFTARTAGSFHVCIKPRLGFLQRKGILVVKNAGTHPAALGQVHDVETAVTLSVSCLVQTKPLALSNAFDVLFLCVSHGGRPC